MKRQFTLEVILICTVFLAACGQTNNSFMRVNLYDTFDRSHHLKPEFPKADFDTLRDWDFGWFLLNPLNIAGSLEHEVELSKQFSPGQKALYFYWFLDAEVTNGGFVQFYYNGKDRYLPPILEGLKLIGDVELINLVLEVEAEYQVNKEKFESYRRRNDFSGLAKTFNWYEKYDQKYYQLHDRTMKLLEQYARKHATEFGEIK